MTEQERFEAWFFKHKREQHSILWGANEPNAALGCKLRLEASHNDMWLAWQAAQQKEGWVLVPVESANFCADQAFVLMNQQIASWGRNPELEAIWKKHIRALDKAAAQEPT